MISHSPRCWINRSSASVVCFLLLSTTAPIFAGSGGTVKLPSVFRKKVKNGIVADIDTRWTAGWGYRPVKIKLTVRKATRDRNIRVDFVPQCNYSQFGGYTDGLLYSANVKIPQGEKSVSKTIYVPQQGSWEVIRADFYEGNRKLKDLSMEYPTSTRTNAGLSYNYSSPCVLLVHRDAPKLDDDRAALIKKLKKEGTKNLPDAEKLEFLTNEYYMQRKPINDDFVDERGRATDDDSLTTVSEMSNVEMLPPSELPDQAIGLAGIDLLIISLEDLQDLASKDKVRFRAIDYWVRNGGNLITYADKPLGDLQASLSDLLKREFLFIPPKASQYPKEVSESYDALATEAAIADESNVDQLSPQARKNKSKQPKQSGVPTDTAKFELAGHGLGRIITIQAKDPYEERVKFWQWLLNTIGTERLTWTERHGVALMGDNTDYWEFMIPGYGQSPVEGFLGVITLFILVIGPLNFYLLKKFKRMYYLPLTVVAAALLTTLTMMVYAVVSDGVATRVRLRSFTLLDQAGDENIAMTRCRQSYLAALTPSDGLVFPSHTCVYPILPYYSEKEKRVETLRERAGERSLSRDYIRSRTTTQFLTTNVEPTKLGIQSTPNGKYKNNLGVKLRYAFICDQNKKLFQAKDIEPGALIDLEPVVFKDTMKELNKYISDNRPEAPEGLTSTTNTNIFGFQQSRRWNRWGYPMTSAYTESALLSQNMKRVPDFIRKPRPQTFMVISNDAPEFVYQGTKATQEAGFHVVRGGLK